MPLSSLIRGTLPLASRSTTPRISLRYLPTSLDGARLTVALPPQYPASVKRIGVVQDYITCCPSAMAFAYALGPTNPPRIILAAEPSDFRWGGFSPPFSVTHSGIRTRSHSTRASALTSWRERRSPTISLLGISCASVACFAPLQRRRMVTRPVSYYAFFQGWLLLSQPPGCLCDHTTFPTQHALRDLSSRSGLFPSRRCMLAHTVSLVAFAYGIRSLPSFGKR
jgi:hypothetical protein